MDVRLNAKGLTKYFNRRKIFSDIGFDLKNEDSLAITGRNGSGKSTLLKIVAGVLSPTHGQINLINDGVQISPLERFEHIGFVAPYLQLYDEFTAMENLRLLNKIRNLSVADGTMTEFLRRLNLFERRNDYVRTYSSGMKQRLKYACALIHEPHILLLDEPTSNLDDEGINTVRQIIREHKEEGILVIATNEAEDTVLCSQTIDMNRQAGGGKT